MNERIYSKVVSEASPLADVRWQRLLATDVRWAAAAPPDVRWAAVASPDVSGQRLRRLM